MTGRRVLAFVLATAAALGTMTTASADDAVWTDVLTASDEFAAPVNRVSWGEWEIEGNFRFAVPIPGRHAVVTLSDGNLATVDVETAEVTLGDAVVATADQIWVSPGGTWVYVGSLFTSPTFTGYRTRFDRYSLADLTFDRSFEVLAVGNEPFNAVDDVTFLPGDESLLVVSMVGGIAVYADGVALPSRFGPYTQDLLGYDSDTFFAVDGTALTEFSVGPTGITSTSIRVAEFKLDDFRIRDGEMIDGALLPDAWFPKPVYSLTDFTTRAATPFDLAVSDSEVGVRYGPHPFGVDVRLSYIYDEATGDLISYDQTWCGPPGVLVGGGLFVDASDTVAGSIHVADFLRRCASYGEFTAVQPARLFDSRTGQGNSGVIARLQGGSTTRVKVHGLAGVPEDRVESVVLNVTGVDQRDAEFGNYITVWPAGYDKPLVASVNLSNGETLGNMVTVSTAAGGYVDVYTNVGTVDLVVDVMGYFAAAIGPGGSRFEQVPNARLVDTRLTDRLGAGQTLRVRPSDQVIVPNKSWRRAQIRALVLNVTAIQSTGGGHFRIFPTGSALPDASAMNFPVGRDINRLVTVKVGDDTSIDIWNAVGEVDVAVDLVGAYFERETDQQDGRFVGLVPERLIDTRESSPFPGDGRVTTDGILISPGYREGISLVTNLTAVLPGGAGYLSAGPWNPDGLSQGNGNHLPQTSSLNYGPLDVIGNQAIISPDDDGEIAVYAATESHFVLDLFGFYTSHV